MWCACLYLEDQAYGGPEEGGWYYTTGEPRPEGDGIDARFFNQRRDAQTWIDSVEVQEQLSDLNQGRPLISSITSEGRYRMLICFGMPEAYPDKTPHYE